MLGEKNAADMNVIIKRIYSLFKDKCRWTAFFVTSSTCNDTIRSVIFCLLTRISCVSLHFGPHEKKNDQKIAWAVTAWNRKRTAIYVTKLIDILQRWNQTRTSWEFKSYTQHNVCFFFFIGIALPQLVCAFVLVLQNCYYCSCKNALRRKI